MKNLLLSLLFVLLFGCNQNGNAPEVDEMKVSLELHQFEKDFFAIDTGSVAMSMQNIIDKYPAFAPDFIRFILGLDPDSVLTAGNEQAEAVKRFIRDYRPVYQAVGEMYGDFSKAFGEIEQSLKYVQYYFPKYALPKHVITFIGPLNATFQTSFGVQADILTPAGLGIGLQLHLGKDFSFYQSAAGQALFPAYMSRNFDRAHIVVNTMKVIVDDLYPPPAPGGPLIEQMVQNGRRLYLLSSFVPHAPDSTIMGYSAQQMEAVKDNEAVIWSFFLNNDLLNSADESRIQNYLHISPKTPEFGEGAPGNLGSYTGWQIVKKFKEEYPEVSLDSLMTMPPRDIYTKSKYKPRN